MPRRPRRLTLNKHPKPPIPSSLTAPTSPAFPRTPLVAPARLSLRPLIPSPPLSPEFLKTVPGRPADWIWRCHLCHRVYRLGVTQRCLDDGHYFCSISEGESTYNITKADGTKITKVRRSCASEFDYSAWGIYNIWRREVRLHKIARLKKIALRNSMVENSRTDEKQKLRKERNAALAGRWRESIGNALEGWGERDCWKDCDFPSECHNFRLLALREKRRRALREAQDDELWRDVYDAEVGSESSSESESESESENDEWDEEEKEGEDGEKLSEFFDFEGAKTDEMLAQGDIVVNGDMGGGEMEEVDLGMATSMQVENVSTGRTTLMQLAQAAAELSAAGSSEFGNIEGNVEALNEASAAAAFASSKRRRSINALASGDISDLEPGSPLKESMDIDSDIPWDSGTDSGGKKEEAKEKSAFRWPWSSTSNGEESSARAWREDVAEQEDRDNEVEVEYVEEVKGRSLMLREFKIGDEIVEDVNEMLAFF